MFSPRSNYLILKYLTIISLWCQFTLIQAEYRRHQKLPGFIISYHTIIISHIWLRLVLFCRNPLSSLGAGHRNGHGPVHQEPAYGLEEVQRTLRMTLVLLEMLPENTLLLHLVRFFSPLYLGRKHTWSCFTHGGLLLGLGGQLLIPMCM